MIPSQGGLDSVKVLKKILAERIFSMRSRYIPKDAQDREKLIQMKRLEMKFK